jgi:hypothetical protein
MSLSTLELSMMRHEAEHFMPGTAVIWRPTESSDGQGGITLTYAAVGTTDCRLSPASMGREQVIAEKLTAIAPWMITLTQGTTVVESDRIIISGAGTFEVAAVLSARSYEVHRRILCTEAT